jgi:protein transport protein SEC24
MPQQPGMGPGGSYMNNGGQQSRKGLDPDSMPNPIQVMADDRAAHPTGQFVTNERGKVPPLVTTLFTTVDQGNSGPGLMRATMYSVPDTPDMKKQTSVPLGLVMSPLAEPGPGEYPVPVVNLGDMGPVRCLRCKAYISPYMVFTDGGKRFQCIFCKATTEDRQV